ncbi:MAG TPA: polysaccharide biosynthesis tyrosine autokinase, partial [Planctomycetaceae bacterium]
GPPLGRLLMRRKWLLLFGLALGAGLGYLYYTRQPPVFQSSVRLLVTQSRPPMATTDGNYRESAPAQDLATQCVTITGSVVITSAVDDFGLADKPGFGSREAALAKLANGLSAAPVQLERTNTSVVEVSYRGATPGECREALESVLGAYRKFLGDSYEVVSDETLREFSDGQKKLLAELDTLNKEYAEFRSGVPLLGQGKDMVNPYAVRLTEVDAERTGLILRRTELQSQIDSILDALARGGNREALTLMLDQLERQGATKSEAVTVAEKLFPLLMEKELLEETGLAKDHPKLKAIERQIAVTRSHLSDLFGASKSQEKPADLLDVYLASLRHELETLRVQEAKLDEIFRQESAAARELDAVIVRERQMAQEIDNKTRMLETIAKRLDEMSFFGSQGVRIEPISQPGQGVRTPAKRNEYMIIGGVLGFVLATGIAYMIEASDKSFRTPEDIRDEVGAPVLGHVPVIATKAAADGGRLSPVLSTVHAPKGPSAESFRLVRTALFFGARGSDLKVVQVTSPDQGDGKSTVASNLAVAIAHSGRRTLLIDADLRRPTVHRIFGTAGGAGLAGVIAGAAEPADAILDSEVPNLAVLPCGPRPENPAELLAGEAFDDLLRWARDRYDFVIVDTPPLLAVSDPGNVACRVDGVLLTLRLGKRTRAKAAEAREILDRVGANVLGIVINGVNSKGESGYRAGYHYTYSTSYRYRYGTYGSNNRYLQDEGRPEAAAANGFAANGRHRDPGA